MNFRQHWELNPSIDFLNHGSFGATPTVVLEKHRQYQQALERDPIKFLAPERELFPKLDSVRNCIGELVNADSKDIALVRNATDGVNAVLRSFDFEAGDELIVTNHGYNACNNVAQFVANQTGASVRVAEIPFPIEDQSQVWEAIERQCSNRTRLLLIDHVTSATGLVFPVDDIVAQAHRRGIRVLVDGAHAPGMLKVDLKAINADYYTANHHKWLCAVKASGFLYVDRQWQDSVFPTVISHAENTEYSGRSRFMNRFDWVGTYNPTALMTVVDSVDFLSGLMTDGLRGLLERNRNLALRSRDVLIEALEIAAPCPDEMIGSLVALPFSDRMTAQIKSLGQDVDQWFYQTHQFEFPIFSLPNGQRMMRVALQAYNGLEQIERLAIILNRLANATSNQ